MMDALMKHRYDLRRIKVDSEYLRDVINKECTGKDGYGPNTKQHIKIWLDTLHESYESFEQVYCNIYQILDIKD